ncbi:uncharacterized protein LOC123550002 [Mercenaria mercenaria]|uniref:uncharacterized protein LOC123550002 n=1 Tax=Mercenaria mercenaria TaxID=6596 RepID=UPI00234F36EE|nr:uncharacterized protein LOC123550002 [Mercenaria mercenaria]
MYRRGNSDLQRRGSMDEDEIANMATSERIQNKEKELKQICLRIELMEKERDLDEKIKKAKDIESFLSKSSTARRADYEKESGIYLTTEDLENAFKDMELNEDGQKLFRFAMRTVAEENMRSRIFDVELIVYLAHNSKVTISKGDPKQKLIILLDEKNEPVFRWEIKTSSTSSLSYR